MKNLLLLFTLFFTTISFGQISGKAGYFAENKDQVRDQKNRPNLDVLYLIQQGNMSIQLRKSGFSYDIFKST